MATSAKTRKKDNHTWRRYIILGAALVFLYAVIPQVKSLSPSIHNLEHAELRFVIIGICLFGLTYPVAAIMYQLLRKHPLVYGRTLLVQVSSGFANRLLPAGLGGMGLIAQYLRKQGHTTGEAITVVSMDDLIGIIGHFLLFFVVILTTNVSFSRIHIANIRTALYPLGVLLIIVVILLIVFQHSRKKIQKSIGEVIRTALGYGKHTDKLFLALLNSLLLTMLYVSVLWSCSHALGFNLSISKILVVFTAGSIVGTATPTPGGLIGTEAGLFAGSVAYGASDGTAFAVALLYRLITYWLPIIPGIIAFSFAQRKLKLI